MTIEDLALNLRKSFITGCKIVVRCQNTLLLNFSDSFCFQNAQVKQMKTNNKP